MNALAFDSTERASRWPRVARIVAVFVAVGPIVASVMLMTGHAVEGLSNPRYAVQPLDWPLVAASWIVISYQVGAPYALLTGSVFAVLAVFFGWRQLWLAIVIAVAPLAAVHLLPAVGPPIWRWELFFSMSALALAVVTTIICWYLSRRWLRRS